MVRRCGFLSFALASSVSLSALAEEPTGGLGLSGQSEAPSSSPGTGVAAVRSESSGPAVVTVESSGTPVTVAQIVSRISATGVGAGGTVTVVGGTYRDLCITPCTFEVKPGLYEFGVHGNGVSGATGQFDLRSGPHKLRANPGSAWVAFGGYALTVIGATTLIVGTVFLFVSDDIMDFPALPLTLIGAGTTGLGIGMMFAGSTSLEKTARLPEPKSLALRKPTGLSFHGSF
jgi:hypothetical protein